jgi:hypothetical protein
MNGKEGDHPLTDILVYRRPTFNDEVDELVRELDSVGCWNSQLLSFLMLGFHDDVRRLRKEGEDRAVETLLHNFARTLRGELESRQA